MKQKQLILAVILAMSIAVPAFAHEGENNTVSMNAEASTSVHIEHKGRGLAGILQKIEDKRDTHQEDRQGENENGDSRASTTAGFKEKMMEKMEKLHDEHGGFQGNIADKRLKNVVKLFQATIDRFDKMVERFDSRIAKIKAAGGNTTEAQASITLAKANIVSAKADLVTLTAYHFGKSSTTASSTDAVNFENAKKLAQKIRDELSSAKDNLMKALKSIVTVQKTIKVDEEASTNASTTVNH